jgi:hypothetical protein
VYIFQQVLDRGDLLPVPYFPMTIIGYKPDSSSKFAVAHFWAPNGKFGLPE